MRNSSMEISGEILIVKRAFRFLFIDDCPITHRYLALLLKANELPISPNFEYAPKSALHKLSKLSDEEFPDVIITDIEMPDMNGFEFIEAYMKQFGASHPKTQLYVSSSLTKSAVYEQVINNPKIMGFIPKPFNLAALEAQILPYIKEDIL